MLRLSVAEQIAAHLRQELRAGRMSNPLPSVRQLAAELGTSKDSITTALRLLEGEGLVSPTVQRQPRRANENADKSAGRRGLRIGLLMESPLDAEDAIDLQEILQFIRSLEREGHVCVFAPKSQAELKHKPKPIVAMLGEMKVDAWIVWGGSRPVLESISQMPVPAFAHTGSHVGLPIAAARYSTDKVMTQAVRHLTSLGHRRIVRIARPASVKSWSATAQAFSDAMAEVGITANQYHFPEWEESPQGLRALLESLFRLTPPTALIVSHADYINGILSFAIREGLKIPKDFSLLVVFTSTGMEWCDPPIAHFQYNFGAASKSGLRWIESVANGRPHKDQEAFTGEFVTGGSIAPPKR